MLFSDTFCGGAWGPNKDIKKLISACTTHYIYFALFIAHILCAVVV